MNHFVASATLFAEPLRLNWSAIFTLSMLMKSDIECRKLPPSELPPTIISGTHFCLPIWDAFEADLPAFFENLPGFTTDELNGF